MLSMLVKVAPLRVLGEMLSLRNRSNIETICWLVHTLSILGQSSYPAMQEGLDDRPSKVMHSTAVRQVRWNEQRAERPVHTWRRESKQTKERVAMLLLVRPSFIAPLLYCQM